MHAYVTLVTNADYAMGALALARSIRTAGSTAPLIVMATAQSGDLAQLEAEGAKIVEVAQPPFSDAFRQRHRRDEVHAAAPFTKGEKPRFHDPLDNFCKLRLWELDGYERLVFIDADAVMLRNCDRLFGYPQFSAAPNLYERLADFDRLNSGVFVAEPGRATFEAMIACLDRPEAFWRRTDQTFLQDWFPEWHGLPYLDNVLQYVFFNLPDLWLWHDIRILHYQYEKPWQDDHPKRDKLQPLIDLWWQLYDGKRPPEDLPTPFAKGQP